MPLPYPITHPVKPSCCRISRSRPKSSTATGRQNQSNRGDIGTSLSFSLSNSSRTPRFANTVARSSAYFYFATTHGAAELAVLLVMAPSRHHENDAPPPRQLAWCRVASSYRCRAWVATATFRRIFLLCGEKKGTGSRRMEITPRMSSTVWSYGAEGRGMELRCWQSRGRKELKQEAAGLPKSSTKVRRLDGKRGGVEEKALPCRASALCWAVPRPSAAHLCGMGCASCEQRLVGVRETI